MTFGCFPDDLALPFGTSAPRRSARLFLVPHLVWTLTDRPDQSPDRLVIVVSLFQSLSALCTDLH